MARLRPRLYDSVLSWHLDRYRQMAFVAGPRQVGKTTSCQRQADTYLNIDNPEHRAFILAGPTPLAGRLGLKESPGTKPVAVLDELHKWRGWKRFLKGFFDTYERRVRLVVTGSARLDVYRRGGDSMMGRYFLYHMHPFSVGEIARQAIPGSPLNRPVRIPETDFRALWEHGGYPEPFTKRNNRFSRSWRSITMRQLVREDVRDVTRIQELAQLDSLVGLLAGLSATRLVYRNIAGTLSTSPVTVKRWISTLASLHHGFLVRPWHRRVTRSLVKEPKWYLRDWSGIEDPGARAETFVACHLIKSVEGWTDLGLGDFGLYYLRDKEQREVDFLVVKDGHPWFLVETKAGNRPLNPALSYFQKITAAKHAFQVVIEMPYSDTNLLERKEPARVPARTLLSQLL